MKITELRWKRIYESNLSFDYIKLLVKEKYNDNIKENDIKSFSKNINGYSNIKEGELLSLLEDISYNKMSIFSIKKEESSQNSIIDTFSTDLGKAAFSKTTKVNINNLMLCTDELDTSVYTLSHYKYKTESIVEIFLYSIKEYEIIIDDSGVEYERLEKVIDLIKFIINLENGIVYMLYSDIDISSTKSKDVTNRKKAFMNLFKHVNSKNLNKWDITEYLTAYVNKYIEDNLSGVDTNKLISTIKTSAIKDRLSLQSIREDYKHSKLKLMAIKEDLDAKTHIISLLECNIKSNIVRLKSNGELSILNSTFQAEVMKDVCNEFFKGEYSL